MRACHEATTDLMGYKLFMLSRWVSMAALMVSGTSSRMSTMSSALLLSSAHAHIRLSTFADVAAAHASKFVIWDKDGTWTAAACSVVSWSTGMAGASLQSVLQSS